MLVETSLYGAWLDALRHISPSPHDVLSIACVLFACLVFTLAGRVVSRGRNPLEIDLVAGWGMACLIFTLAGAARLPLYWGYAPLLLVPALGFRRLRFHAGEWRDAGRLVLCALPLLVVIAGLKLWQSDAFSFWIPNFYYVTEHHAFPVAESLPTNSFFYAFPYNLQIAGYAASFLGEMPKAMMHFNIVLNLVCMLFLARVIAVCGQDNGNAWTANPSWTACLFAVAAFTLFNPAFVPAIALSSYGDLTTGVTLAFTAIYAYRALHVEEGEYSPLTLGLLLAALINIKQANIVLVAAVLSGVLLIALLNNPRKTGEYARRILPALIAPVVIYLAWRYYVFAYSPGRENEVLPITQWPFDKLGAILKEMAAMIARKGGFFILLAFIVLHAVQTLRKRSFNSFSLTIVYAAYIILFYQAFLITIYLAWTDAGRAISYWRYSTHLAPLAILAALPIIALFLLRIPALARGLSKKPFRAALLALYVAAPFLLVTELRYDLAERKGFVRDISAEIAALVPGNSKLAIVTEGYNKLDDYLSYRGLVLFHNRALDIDYSPKPLEFIREAPEYGYMLLSCLEAEKDLKKLEVTLLRRDGGFWHHMKTWKAPPTLCYRRQWKFL